MTRFSFLYPDLVEFVLNLVTKITKSGHSPYLVALQLHRTGGLVADETLLAFQHQNRPIYVKVVRPRWGMYYLNQKTLCPTSNPALCSAELPFLVQKMNVPLLILPLYVKEK